MLDPIDGSIVWETGGPPAAPSLTRVGWDVPRPGIALEWVRNPDAELPDTYGFTLRDVSGDLIVLQELSVNPTVDGRVYLSGVGRDRIDVVWTLGVDENNRISGMVASEDYEWIFWDVDNTVTRVLRRPLGLDDAECGITAPPSTTVAEVGSLEANAYAPVSLPQDRPVIDVGVATTIGARVVAEDITAVGPSFTGPAPAVIMLDWVHSFVNLTNVALRQSGATHDLRLVHWEEADLGAFAPFTYSGTGGAVTGGGDQIDMNHATPSIFDCLIDPNGISSGSSACASATAPAALYNTFQQTLSTKGADLAYVITENTIPEYIPGTTQEAGGWGQGPSISPSGAPTGPGNCAPFDGGTQTACWSGQYRPSAVQGLRPGWNAFAHEVGHLAGAAHGRWQGPGASTTPPVAIPLDPPLPGATAYLAPDCTYSSIMGYSVDPAAWAQNYCPAGGTPATFTRTVPFFSNTCAEYSYSGALKSLAGVTGAAGSPTTLVDFPADNIGNGINLVGPAIAALYPTLVPQVSGAILTAPLNGHVLTGTSTTYSWTFPGLAPAAGTTVEIHVGAAAGSNETSGTYLHNTDPAAYPTDIPLPLGPFAWPVASTTQGPTGGTSPPTPWGPPRRYVRVWTLPPSSSDAPPVYRDYVLNIADDVLDCNAVDQRLLADQLPPNTLRDLDRTSPVNTNVPTAEAECRSVCTWTGGTLACDVDPDGLVPNPGHRPWVIATSSNRPNGPSDHFVYGIRELEPGSTDEPAFCCMYKQQATTISQIEISSTQRGDDIRLQTCSNTLRPVGTSALEVVVRAYGGPDTVFGSSYSGSDYYEWLYSHVGHDEIESPQASSSLFGGRGDDHLYGGQASNLINGGPGDDWLYGRSGPDLMYGGEDNDMVLGEAGDDTLQGGPGTDDLEGGTDHDILCDHGIESDFLAGGPGDDHFFMSPEPGALPQTNASVDLGAGSATCSSPTLNWLAPPAPLGAPQCDTMVPVASPNYWTDRCIGHDGALP